MDDCAGDDVGSELEESDAVEAADDEDALCGSDEVFNGFELDDCGLECAVAVTLDAA